MDPSSPCFNYFPIIYFNSASTQRFDGEGVGQGIILVENGNMEFEGLSGSFTFYGLIISKGPGGEGLEIADTNFQLYGAAVASSNIALDGGDIDYSKCAIGRALAAHGIGGTGGAAMSERMWRQAVN